MFGTFHVCLNQNTDLHRCDAVIGKAHTQNADAIVHGSTVHRRCRYGVTPRRSDPSTVRSAGNRSIDSERGAMLLTAREAYECSTHLHAECEALDSD